MVTGEPAGSEETLRQARALLEEKHFAEARQILDAWLADHPQDEAALGARAEVLRLSGHFPEARADYEKLAALRPTDGDPWFWIGALERWQGRDSAAIKAFDQAIARAGCHMDARRYRAAALQAGGHLAEAERDLREALKCLPGDQVTIEQLAVVLLAEGQKTPAEDLIRSLALPNANLKLGDLALAADRPSEAAAYYRKALEGQAGQASAWRGLGEAERRLGSNQQAFEAYQHAVALDPADTGSQYWIGVIGTWLGRTAEADAGFNEVLARRGEDPGALIGKARLAFYTGRRTEALELVNRTLAVDSTNQEARLLRGQILAAAGRANEARDDYAWVLARDPRQTEALAALRTLPVGRGLVIEGWTDRSRVIEGLELRGVLGVAEVEYIGEGVRAEYRQRISDDLSWTAALSQSRQAVSILGSPKDTGGSSTKVYDFDVLGASLGLDGRLGDAVRYALRLGGSAYDSRLAGSIPDENRFEGSAWGEWSAGRSVFWGEILRDTFVQRGFAGDTEFRIFHRDRLHMGWRRSLGGPWGLEAGTGVSRYSDGNEPFFGWAGLTWDSGPRSAWLRYRHDPFPARFFDEHERLIFIPYDVLSVGGRFPLPLGFSIWGEGLLARYGKTPPILLNGSDYREISPDNNWQTLYRGQLAWTQPGFPPLTLAIGYFNDRYDFLTGPYNNRNTHEWLLSAELNGDLAPRWRYLVHYGHGLIGDDRDGSYGADKIIGRLEFLPGSLARRAGPVRLVLEGSYRRQAFDSFFYYFGDPRRDDFSESFRAFRLILHIPF